MAVPIFGATAMSAAHRKHLDAQDIMCAAPLLPSLMWLLPSRLLPSRLGRQRPRAALALPMLPHCRRPS